MMPTVVRYYVKTAIVYLILSLITALLLALSDVVRIPQLRLIYFHLLVVGWITQLIMGVAYWMFPRFTKERPRGHEWMAWTTLVLINVGLLLRAIGEPLTGKPAGGWLLGTSALMQFIAGWLFVYNIWPRVKGR